MARSTRRRIALALSGLALLIAAPPAHAVIGRPATPGSVAGVARRTTRRRVRRTARRVATLPAGCAPVAINGVTYQRCGGTYYEPAGAEYIIVQVD